MSRAEALQDAFWLQAEHLLMYHTNPWELDEALCAAGYAMGPFEAQDLLGLDRVLARAPERPLPILRRMVAEGRLGKQGGVGFYRYPGGGGAVIDPLIEDLILEEAWFAKVTREPRDDAFLVREMDRAVQETRTRLGSGMSDAVLARALHFHATGQKGSTEG